MMVLKKKTIIIITLVLLIVAAGYVSTKYGKTIKVDTGKQTEDGTSIDTSANNDQVASGYFIDEKLGRENERSARKQELNDLINNKNTTKDNRIKAENELLSLVNFSEKEMIIEALIKAKGFDDALVFLSDSSANVTVKAKSINAEQANQIKNVVCRESGFSAAKVSVQCRE